MQRRWVPVLHGVTTSFLRSILEGKILDWDEI